MTSLYLRRLIAVSAAVALTCVALGDVVETTNGARLVGKVTKVEGDVVYLTTEYAGDLKIKQANVVQLTTDAPLTVRLSSGTVLQGVLSGGASGALVITGADGSLNTQVNKVAATWAPGATDPAIIELQRHWTYEVAADVTGKTGNKEQLGTSVSGRAVLKTKQDTLQFYTAYDRQISDGAKSADQFKAGVDYSDNFSGRKSWYVRDEGGFDRIKDINLYNTAAVGLGYDLIKEPKHLLTIRGGLSYQYEGYKNPATTDVNSAGLDFGLSHQYDTARWSLVNRLSYEPIFKEIGNFRLIHESFFEIPLNDASFKVRFGVSNDYNSRPGVGTDKLDTTYFTRLVLNWK